MVVICDDQLETKFVVDTNLIPNGKYVTSLPTTRTNTIIVLPSQQRLYYDYGRPQ